MNASVPPGERMGVEIGDITRLPVDAIVNAANSQLRPGGGVCGAIHHAAGPGLAKECRALAPCPTGEARITRGHDLPARYVIHTVGPVYADGHSGEAAQLAACYTSCLRLALERRLESVAFPAISTGIFGYPADAACDVAVRTVHDWLERHEWPREVIFCCFTPAEGDRYRRRLARS